MTNALRKQGSDGVPRWRGIGGAYLLPGGALILMLVGSLGSSLFWLIGLVCAVIASAINVANAVSTEGKNRQFFHRMIGACLVLAIITALLLELYG